MASVVVIAGPTASGKSSLSIALAKKLDGEIISADSRQVYKLLDIGTAKVTVEEQKAVPHHLIDLKLPNEEFNAFEFETLAFNTIALISEQGKLPIVAGGSGLYVRALLEGISYTADVKEDVREQIQTQLREHGRDFLYTMLLEQDPITAATMLPQNYKRVVRALEVLLSTGKSIREHHQSYKREHEHHFVTILLNPEREPLYSLIDARVDTMLRKGLIDEVKNLMEMGFSPEINALNTVGYKEIFMLLNGEIDQDEAIRLIKRNTRHFAKRQYTWFRKMNFDLVLDFNPFTESEFVFEKVDLYLSQKLKHN